MILVIFSVFFLQKKQQHLQSLTFRPAPPSSSALGAAPWHRRAAAATRRVCLRQMSQSEEAPREGIPSFLKANCPVVSDPSGYLW